MFRPAILQNPCGTPTDLTFELIHFDKCFRSKSPENTRNPWFPGVFRRYKMGTLARNGLFSTYLMGY